jgi:hypothetical protein
LSILGVCILFTTLKQRRLNDCWNIG